MDNVISFVVGSVKIGEYVNGVGEKIKTFKCYVFLDGGDVSSLTTTVNTQVGDTICVGLVDYQGQLKPKVIGVIPSKTKSDTPSNDDANSAPVAYKQQDVLPEAKTIGENIFGKK